jgi:hypothetical protein
MLGYDVLMFTLRVAMLEANKRRVEAKEEAESNRAKVGKSLLEMQEQHNKIMSDCRKKALN